METTLENLAKQAREAQQARLHRALALRDLVEMSESGRRTRARTVLESGCVRWVRPNEDEEEGSIKALVSSRGKKTPQFYSVKLTVQNDQVRKYHCDCHDHGRQGACKHVLAVAGVEILRLRAEWMRLKRAIRALTGEPDA
jgi:uncharacterized Zn finger protein